MSFLSVCFFICSQRLDWSRSTQYS